MARPKTITAPAKKAPAVEFNPDAIEARIRKILKEGRFVDRYGRPITDWEEIDTLVELALGPDVRDSVRLDAAKALAELRRVKPPRMTGVALRGQVDVRQFLVVEEVSD